MSSTGVRKPVLLSYVGRESLHVVRRTHLNGIVVVLKNFRDLRPTLTSVLLEGGNSHGQCGFDWTSPSSPLSGLFAAADRPDPTTHDLPGVIMKDTCPRG